MLHILTLITSYPLILRNIETEGDITYAYLDIQCQSEYTISLEYNDVIDNPEKWQHIYTVPNLTYNNLPNPNNNFNDSETNHTNNNNPNNNSIIIQLDQDLSPGYYTFKLTSPTFYTYTQPFKKKHNTFTLVSEDLTPKFSKIKTYKNEDEDSYNVNNDAVGKHKWANSHLFGLLLLVVIFLCLVCIFSQRNSNFPSDGF